MTSPNEKALRKRIRKWLLVQLAIPLSCGCIAPGQRKAQFVNSDPQPQISLVVPSAIELGETALATNLPPATVPDLETVLPKTAVVPAKALPVANSLRPTVQSTAYHRPVQVVQPTPLASSAYARSTKRASSDNSQLTSSHGDVHFDTASQISELSTSQSLALNEIPADVDIFEPQPQVIDLSSALGMAGGNAWSIQLARQKTIAAHADVLSAEAKWLPNLQFGIGWNKHDGRIQTSDGQVIEASRGSLFVGGGSTWGTAPVAGGSGGPLRLSADLALADAYFGTRIADRMLSAQRVGVSVARNDALLRAGLAYVDLVEAAGRVADAQAAIDAASKLVHMTEQFEQAGAGAQADVDRARTELARLEGVSQNAVRLFNVRSASLARALRLDPRFRLLPADQLIVPVSLFDTSLDLESQIATALATRPEFLQIRNQISAYCLEVDKAQVEPWIPHVAMAASAGSFGGGVGSQLNNSADRSDIDLQAVWQLDSMGLGTSARRQRARSILAQQRIRLADFRDEVTAQVVRAYEDVINYRTQIDSAESALASAASSYQRNFDRVRADEGLPIELLQAIQAQATGLNARTTAVSNYNRAQLELAHAAGQLSL